MPVMQFLNGGPITVLPSADASSGATSISLTSVTGLPTAPEFFLLDRETGELLRVTGPTPIASPITVVRASGGTTAAAINGTSSPQHHLDYSITREMLALGFPIKLDETVAPSDQVAGVLTLAVPAWASGLGVRGLRVVLTICAGTATGVDVGSLLMRINSDATTTVYFTEFAYWGSSSAAVTGQALAFARLPWVGSENTTTPTNFSQHTFDIVGALDTDRYKTWSGTFHSPSGIGNRYGGVFGGEWRTAGTAVSSLNFSVDIAQNLVWASNTIKTGSRAILYGLP